MAVSRSLGARKYHSLSCKTRARRLRTLRVAAAIVGNGDNPAGACRRAIVSCGFVPGQTSSSPECRSRTLIVPSISEWHHSGFGSGRSTPTRTVGDNRETSHRFVCFIRGASTGGVLLFRRFWIVLTLRVLGIPQKGQAPDHKIRINAKRGQADEQPANHSSTAGGGCEIKLSQPRGVLLWELAAVRKGFQVLWNPKCRVADRPALHGFNGRRTTPVGAI
jgi:hypothetical protein